MKKYKAAGGRGIMRSYSWKNRHICCFAQQFACCILHQCHAWVKHTIRPKIIGGVPRMHFFWID